MAIPTQDPTTPETPESVDTDVVRKGYRRTQRDFPKRGFLPAMKRVNSSRNARTIAIFLVMTLIGAACVMVFSPWQQTLRGSGSVVNYDPTVRPQPIAAPITGRIARLGPGIAPMAKVTAGQFIAEMEDLDSQRLVRLRTQLANLEQAVLFARQSVESAIGQRNQSQLAVDVYRSNIETLKAVKRETVAAAEVKIEIAKQNLEAAVKALEDREAKLFQAQENYKRQKQLFEEDIASELQFQMADQAFKSATAAVGEAEAKLQAAREDVGAKQKERNTAEETAEASIKSASATLKNGESKVESDNVNVAKAEQELKKAMNAVAEAETAVNRQANQTITAPIDGYLVEIYADAGGRVYSQGDMIARIVPESEDRIVEIWLDGNDAPLVEPGRHVRLQFEGWPAIQFSGWPSVAVGTFGGEVLSVDATDDGRGKFRALIGEVSGLDEETGLVDEPWPHGRFLRPGVRANGWVLLETVPLWWEVWRNLNGFPPIVDVEHDDVPVKTPKLPK